MCGHKSAPTSGGKTLVAELLILRALLQQNGTMALLVVPFIALAMEKRDYLRDVWAPLQVGRVCWPQQVRFSSALFDSAAWGCFVTWTTRGELMVAHCSRVFNARKTRHGNIFLRANRRRGEGVTLGRVGVKTTDLKAVGALFVCLRMTQTRDACECWDHDDGRAS